jgi:hypothetical protein
MSLGAVLLQPDKVRRAAAANTNVSLAEDVAALVARIALDQALNGVVLTEMGSAIEAMFTRLLDGMGEGKDRAQTRFAKLVKPLVDRVTAMAAEFGKEDAQGALDGGEKLFALLVDLARALTVDQLRALLDEVFDVVDKDFGFTNTFVDDQVWRLLDDIVDRLGHAPAGEDAARHQNRREIAILLRRLKRKLRGQFVLPPLNSDRIAGPLLSFLRNARVEDYTKKAADFGDGLKNGFTAGSAIADLVKMAEGNGGGTTPRGLRAPGLFAADPPAGEQKKCWYASWTFSKSIFAADPNNCPDVTDKFSFGDTLTQPVMEKIAFHSRWSMSAAEAIFYLASLEHGDFVSCSLQAARCATESFLIGLAERETPWWADFLIALCLPTLTAWADGAAEGRDILKSDYDGVQYLIWYLADMYEGLLYFYWTRLAREFLLSLLTLINYKGALGSFPSAGSDRRPLNRNYIEGVTLAVMEAGTWILAAIFPKWMYSIDHNQDNHPTAKIYCGWFLGALGISVISFFVGGTIAGCIAWTWPDDGDAALTWLIGYGISLFSFPFAWISLNEGKPCDGTVGYRPGFDPVEIKFEGYPDPSDSPYLLPFEGFAECVQGNHGMASHNSLLDPCQNMAYDFSLNFDTEILCMRDGIIHEVSDGIDDGVTDGEGNNILIRHSDPTSTDPAFQKPNAKHDRGENGAVADTFALYLHGRKGSITAALAAAGLKKGDVVRQGQVIMRCDHTGISQFNHLHIHVCPHDGAGEPANYTIPFVFREVTNVVSKDGVPQSFNWYKSDNKKIP